MSAIIGKVQSNIERAILRGECSKLTPRESYAELLKIKDRVNRSVVHISAGWIDIISYMQQVSFAYDQEARSMEVSLRQMRSAMAAQLKDPHGFVPKKDLECFATTGALMTENFLFASWLDLAILRYEKDMASSHAQLAAKAAGIKLVEKRLAAADFYFDVERELRYGLGFGNFTPDLATKFTSMLANGDYVVNLAA